MTPQVRLPPKLIPVFAGNADVRGAYGGRGSGKTRSFAKMAAVRGLIYGRQGVSGQILCARQFMNSLDDSSLEECKRAIQEEPFLLDYYDIGRSTSRAKTGASGFHLLAWIATLIASNQRAASSFAGSMKRSR